MLASGRRRAGLKGLVPGGDFFVDLSSATKEALIEAEQIDGLLEIAGVDGVKEILDAFWRSTDQLSADLERSVREGEFVAAARTAHALKGSAANVGANRLAEAARIVEVHSRGGDLPEAKEAIERLAAIYRETREALERHISAHG
jgi:HPt (histidine-containing phosphotransfer) domain-containing protein